VRPLLLFASVALVIGFVAVRTDVEPYETPFFHLFFSNTLHMKAWLTTAALLLGLGQLLTAARIYGKLRFPPEGRLYPLLHRWSGRRPFCSLCRPLTIASSSSVSGHTMPAPLFTRFWAPLSTVPFPPKSS
jgi:uncharacterized protein DUF6529